MAKRRTKYAGARSASSAAVELISGEPTRIGGRTFLPGRPYPADDPMVLANRRAFRVSEQDAVEPEQPVEVDLEQPDDSLESDA
jgi:hypothetical protein